MPRAGMNGGDGEAAGVTEAIEHIAIGAIGRDAQPIERLIEVAAGFLARTNVDEQAQARLLDRDPLRRLLAPQPPLAGR